MARAESTLLISFIDLTHYRLNATRTPDGELADIIDGYYELVGERVARAGGRVVKFIGDAALIVFDEARAEAGVLALLELKAAGDAYFAARGWDSLAIVKAHVGTVIAGEFGARGDKRYDVIGNTVNAAATLPSRGFAISSEAYARLGEATRARFRENSPPLTYVPT